MSKYLDLFTPRELMGIRECIHAGRGPYSKIAFFYISHYITEKRVRELSHIFVLGDNGIGDLTVGLPFDVHNGIVDELFERAHCEAPKHIIAGKEFTAEELKSLCKIREFGWGDTLTSGYMFFGPDDVLTSRVQELIDSNLMTKYELDDCTCYRMSKDWKSEFENYVKSICLNDELRSIVRNWA